MPRFQYNNLSSYRKRTTSRDLMIGLSFSICLFLIIFGVIYYSYLTVHLKNDLNNRAANITQELAKVMALPLWNSDSTLIQQMANAYLKSEYLVGVRIIENSDGIFFEKIPKYKSNITIKTAKIIYDKNVIGSIELWFTDKNIINARKTLIFVMIILILSMIAIIIFVTHYIMSFFLGKPLNDLNQSLAVIAQGDYKNILSPVSQEDINAIINGVNMMTVEIGKREEKLKHAENQLQKTNKELEERVNKRTSGLQKAMKKFQKAKKDADAATQAKSEFLANMSHEIRTPMNGVIAAAELALNENMSPKLKQYLNIIQSSGYSLLGIINDILDFSKIEAGKLNLEETPFFLNDVLQNLINMHVNKAQEKEIELFLDINPHTSMALNGDPLRLQQILTNLVGNAIKFTKTKGMITVGVKEFEKSTDQVKLIFFVSDTGIGMKPDQLRKLFQPFTQADASTTRKYGGTGLGLTISKQLIEMMNGEIWAESEYSKGTTFHFTIWMKRQPGDQEKKLIVPSEIKNLNVLVVDDNPISTKILTKILNSFGYRSETVTSGFEALKKIKQDKSFDLIILDWKMPEMDGIETAIKIRNELNDHLPMIMLTEFGKEAEKMAAGRVQINSFLIKPINPSSLFDSIMDVYGKNSLKPIQQPMDIKDKTAIYKKQLQGKKVLLAEDNPTNQQIAEAILNQANVNLTIVNNGKKAVDAVQHESFDVILMDMQMPEMDGYEATRTIRQNSRFASLPIIAMTANAMKGDEEKCLKAGMNGYVTKPISQDALFGILHRCLKDNGPAIDKEKLNHLCGIIMPEIWKAHGDKNWDKLMELVQSLYNDANLISEKRIMNISRNIEKRCKNNATIPTSLLSALESEITMIFKLRGNSGDISFNY